MKSNVRWQQIGGEGEFKISDTQTHPIFTMEDALVGTERSFIKDGMVSGMPVHAQVIVQKDGGFVPYKETKGVLVKDEGGVYILPFSMLMEKHSNADGDSTIVEEAGEVVGGVVEGVEELGEKVIKETEKFNPKSALGFSYKQLLVIGVVALIVIKLKK